jgi:hypothetical protein
VSTLLHPKQIRGSYPGNLWEQLQTLDLDMANLDIEYQYDSTTGAVRSETIRNADTSQVIKTTSYTYHADGSVNTETVTKGTITYVKTYGYDPATGNISNVTIRKTN